MKTATITETKNGLSALLGEVQRGETIVVLDRDRPVARIDAIDTDCCSVSALRMQRLIRDGVLLAPRRGSGVGALLDSEPVTMSGGKSAVEALIEERESGR